MIRKKYVYTLTSILLCGMAVHYMFVTIMLNDNISLKFWKEIILIILVGDTLLSRMLNGDIKGISMDYTGIILIFFVINLSFAALFMTNNISNAVFVARRYLIPIFVYYFAKRNNILSKKIISKLIKVILVFYSVIASWGIFQAFVLGDDFLINLGYPLKYEGRLRDSYYFGGFGDLQRVVSTFSNTNVFGAVLGILIILVLFNPTLTESFKYKKYCIFLLMLAFILTFSRSNWLSMSIVMLFPIIKNNKIRKKILPIFLSISFILLIYNLITDVNIFQIFQKYMSDTLTMKDDSAAGRSGIWQEGLTIFMNNPFGIGLGKVGTVSEGLSGEISIAGESSYIALLLDTGIFGAMSYILALITIYDNTKKYANMSYELSNFFKTVRTIIIYLLIMFLFSNHIYDLEIMIIAFFIFGLSKNKIFINSLIV